MNEKSKLLTILSFVVIAAWLFGCAGMMAKPTEKNFKAPVVTLDSMEVAHAFGFWYYAKSVQPTKGTADNVGAPLKIPMISRCSWKK